MLFRIKGCNGSAERMPCKVPVFYLRMIGKDGIRGVYIEKSQVQRHFQQDAEESLFCKGFHQRGVGGVFHLPARVKDQSGFGIFRPEEDPVFFCRDREAGEICRKQFFRGGIRVVIIIDPERPAREKQQNEPDEDA